MFSGKALDISETVARLVREHGSGREALLPVLHGVKKRFGEISDMSMQLIADRLGVHPSEVYGVVSFYSFFGSARQGKYVIRLCRTISCDMAGKQAVARQLEAELGISFGETTNDGRFALEWANCMGLCDQGPAVMVNDIIHAKVDATRAHELIEGCRKAFSPYTAQEASHAQGEVGDESPY